MIINAQATTAETVREQQASEEKMDSGALAMAAVNQQLREAAAKKDKIEKEARDAILSKAKDELAAMISERAKMTESKYEGNRREEHDFLVGIQEALDVDNPWERVASLIDTGRSKKTEDTEDPKRRMRKVLLQLKQSEDAPGRQ